MTDEAAVLLRISVFGFVAGVIYWSLSYEPLGTAGVLLLGAGPGFAGLYLLAQEDLGILPSPSIWPFALALGLTLAATGPVIGFWSLLLGLGLIALAAIGWQAAVNREQRHGRLEHPRRDQDGRPGP